MEIIEKAFHWSGYLEKRKKNEKIVLHHAAASVCSPDDIHRIHLLNGWAGIGYHFFIRKDGTITRGRPLWSIGAHTSGHNSNTVGICFEGNFEKENMPLKQLEAGKCLVSYLKGIYPGIETAIHKELNATACPGRKFPAKEIMSVKSEITETSLIVESLLKRKIMTDEALWKEKCVSNSNAYHIARKICNKTLNSPKRTNELKTVNDIVWELSHRGIITDKNLWLCILKDDADLYWLCYKAANQTANKEG